MINTTKLRELEQAATLGAWTAVYLTDDVPDSKKSKFGVMVAVGIVDAQDEPIMFSSMEREDDMELIAAMRNALPEILDELEAAQRQRAISRKRATATGHR